MYYIKKEKLNKIVLKIINHITFQKNAFNYFLKL